MNNAFPGRHAFKKDRGMVLILVLLVFALAAIISSELSYKSHREVRRTSNILQMNELYFFARGGEAFAIDKLLKDFDLDQSLKLKADYLTEAWAVESFPYDPNDDENLSGLSTGNLVEDNFLDDVDEDEVENPLAELGEITIVIEDLQGRFNVNNVLMREGEISGVAQFESLINALMNSGEQEARYYDNGELIELEEDYGEDESPYGELDDEEQLSLSDLDLSPSDLALALVDWLDEDEDSALVTGAEDDFYEQRTPAYKAGNQSMLDISELKAVKGFDREDFYVYQRMLPERSPLSEVLAAKAKEEEDDDSDQGLLSSEESNVDENGNLLPEQPSAVLIWGGVEHFVTALPTGTKINVNTASVQVLQTIFSQDQASKIVNGRVGSPYQKPADIFLNLEEIKAADQERYLPYLSTHSEYFLASIIAVIGETSIILRSKLYRDSKGRLKVLSRDYSS